MFRKMLIGALAAVALLAAPAAAQYNITVTPDPVPPGGTITVTGDLCAAGAIVTITLSPTTAQRAALDGPIELGSGQANEEGEYAIDVQIPADLDPGTYDLAVFCDGGFVRSVQITIAGPEVPTTQPPRGGGDIVRTGSDLNGLGLMGAGLLLGGGMVLFATRERRHPAR
jgi:hypothetical protein